MLCQDVACWVSAAGLRGGQTVAAYVTSWAAGTVARLSLKEDFIYIYIYLCLPFLMFQTLEF